MSKNSEYLKKIWERALEIFKDEMSQVSFETWIKGIKVLELSKNRLKLLVANDFSKSIVESRYSKLIKATIKELTGEDVQIEYVIKINMNQENIENSQVKSRAYNTCSYDDGLKILAKKKLLELLESENIENQLKAIEIIFSSNYQKYG